MFFLLKIYHFHTFNIQSHFAFIIITRTNQLISGWSSSLIVKRKLYICLSFAIE